MAQTESRFYLPIDIFRGSGHTVVYAPFVQSLPLQYGALDSAMVLSSDDGRAQQGLYFYNDFKYLFAVDQKQVAQVIKGNYDIAIYYQLDTAFVIPPKSSVYMNGVITEVTEVSPNNNNVWVVITERNAGTVESINGINPDANGNVVINASDIPGSVLSVNNVYPVNGEVVLAPSDIGAIAVSTKGQPNGVATLGPDGKIPTSQLPEAVMGGLTYQGVYDAETDTPPLPTPSTENKGFYWVVSVAGIQHGLELEVGDWIVSNGTSYDEVDNQAVKYASFNPNQTVWVDPNGDPVNGTGIRSNPYTTISQAITEALAGSTIVIAPGVYPENISVGSKMLALQGWEPGQTIIQGSFTYSGLAPVLGTSLTLNYSGTEAALHVKTIGGSSSNYLKLVNLEILTNNTQTAILTDDSDGTWAGELEISGLQLPTGGKINHAAGTGKVTVHNLGKVPATVLEVHGGSCVYDSIEHLNFILHEAGSLAVRKAKVGTDPGVAALTSNAPASPSNFLGLFNVSTWIDNENQTYINKVGDCAYVVDGLTRNLTKDVFTGTELPIKSSQDKDTIVSYFAKNYSGFDGDSLFNHLSGIDTALGQRLQGISSVAGGTSLVADPQQGILKSLYTGDGIELINSPTSVQIANNGVLFLSNVGGTGTTSLIENSKGRLKSIKGAGGLTISESGGVITLTSTQAETGVTTLNGLTGAVNISALAPLSTTLNGQVISLSYSGLRSLNGVVGAGLLIAGLGIDVNTVGSTVTVTNTGVHYLRAGGSDLTEGVVLQAGTNVTITSDPATNVVTISSSGGGGTSGVTSLNSLEGDLAIKAGSGVSVAASGTDITISATGAANPVTSLNNLKGDVNLVGDGGISVSASGTDTLVLTYDGGAGVAVTSLNGKTGALSIEVGDGLELDTTNPNTLILTNSRTGLSSVINATDSTLGSVGLVASDGSVGGQATIKKLLPSEGVSFVETDTGIQILVAAASGTGTVSSVAGISPDSTGNVPLSAEDLGALKADGSVPLTDNLNAAGFSIDNLKDPTEPQQPTTLNYLQELIIDQGTF